jgi:hypothetical protein
VWVDGVHVSVTVSSWSAVCRVQCAECSAKFAECSVQNAVCRVQSAVCRVQCKILYLAKETTRQHGVPEGRVASALVFGQESWEKIKLQANVWDSDKKQAFGPPGSQAGSNPVPHDPEGGCACRWAAASLLCKLPGGGVWKCWQCKLQFAKCNAICSPKCRVQS